MKVYVAMWNHTWGEYSGIAGIFSTRQKADDALQRLAPKSYACNGYVAGVEIREIELDADGENE